MNTKEKVFISDHNGQLVEEGYPFSTAYIREDIFNNKVRQYETEHDINASLRRSIESYRNEIARLQQSAFRNSQEANEGRDVIHG